MKPMKFGIGQSARRVEDVRFITGAGQYTDDIPLKKALVAYVLRSPHAHATFNISNIDAAKAADGVQLVLTAADLAHFGSLPCLGVPDDQGSVELNKDGTFIVRVGTQSNGQGHATAYAQVVSQYLDVPLEQVYLIQGDSRAVPTGHGTGGSRSIPVGAAMLNSASEKLSVQLKDLAADILEAAPSDVEIANGHIRIMGTDRALAYADIAASPKAIRAAGGYKSAMPKWQG
eukprot:gene13358-13473_t